MRDRLNGEPVARYTAFTEIGAAAPSSLTGICPETAGLLKFCPAAGRIGGGRLPCLLRLKYKNP